METLCEFPVLRIPSKASAVYYSSTNLHFEALLTYHCPQVTNIVYNWTIKPWVSVGFGGSSNQTAVFTGQGQVLNVPPRVLQPGKYEVSANVTLVGSILYATKETIILISPTIPVAQIDGGSVRKTSRDDNVIIDASQSYDPDDTDHQLLFFWECYVLQYPDRQCFNFSVPPVLTSDPDIAVRVLQQSENSLLDRSFYSSFPPGVSNTQPTLFFQANQLHPHSDSFVFKVNVTKNGSYLTSYTTFLLQVVETSNIERINLTCPTCWQERMTNKHVGTAFVADCYDCGVDVAYTWSIKLVQDRSRSFYRNESSDCVQPGGEGWMSWNVTNNIPFTNLTGQEIPWNVCKLVYLFC
ncbi:polycystin-1-like protein 1 [Ciona intestinalis]